MINKLLIFFGLLWIFPCAARTIEMTDTGPDVRIPTKIWEKVGSIEPKDAVTFSTITVKLVEKTSGVLIDPELEIKLPRGGGEIDLSQLVRGQGTFRVFFEFEETENKDKMQIYFVSKARKRKIDGEIWGAGCKKFMDLKNYLLKAGKEKGIEVNTTRNRHDSVLGGTFFFLMGRQVTQVTFTDHQQPQLFCENAKAE